MALLECLRCTTRFAVGLLHCPHCLSEEFQEADLPKITVGGGASHPEDLAALSGLPVPPAPVAAGPEVVPVPDAEPVAAGEVPAGVPEPAAVPEAAPEVPAVTVKPAPSLSSPKKTGSGD